MEKPGLLTGQGCFLTAAISELNTKNKGDDMKVCAGGY